MMKEKALTLPTLVILLIYNLINITSFN